MFLRWLTKNWANTTEPTHADLQPLTLNCRVPEAEAKIIAAIATLRGWSQVPTLPSDAEQLHLIRKTRLARFIDDIRITISTLPQNGVRVDAASRSRLGTGDFGQNRRNILELWAAVRQGANHA